MIYDAEGNILNEEEESGQSEKTETVEQVEPSKSVETGSEEK